MEHCGSLCRRQAAVVSKDSVSSYQLLFRLLKFNEQTQRPWQTDYADCDKNLINKMRKMRFTDKNGNIIF